MVKSEKVEGKDLHLGDVIDAGGMVWGTATVKNITDKEIMLFRPYVHTADFSCSAGVICYIGFEEFTVSKDSVFDVLEYGKPLK